MAEPSGSNYPASLDDTTSLLNDQVALTSFTLSGDHDDTTTTIVTTGTILNITPPNYLLINTEIIHFTGISTTNFTGCTRGADGTTAALHNGGTAIYHIATANWANQIRKAIIAIQTELGTDPAGSTIDLATRLIAINTSDSSYTGLGTPSPQAPLHIHSVNVNTDRRIILTDATTGSGSGNEGFIIAKGSDEAGYIWNYENTELRFGTNNQDVIYIKANGNIGFWITTFGTNAAKVLAIGNGTAPTTSITDGIQLWAEDVAGSSELRVRDEAGNVTTLSPHVKDAPDWMYDKGVGLDEVHRIANHYIGEVTFTNNTRKNNLLQKMINNEALPTGEKATFILTETFAEYKIRTGITLIKSNRNTA